VATGKILWSEETFRIFQYDRTATPTVDLVLQRVHPEDRDLVKRAVGNVSPDAKDFNLEHRLLMPDGSVKHLHVVAHAKRDKSGKIEFVGAVMDVTVAKEAADKIRLIINTVPGLLWTARPDGWVDFLNQRWLDYTGMTLEQGLGWAWQPGYHPDDLENLLIKWRAAVAERKPLEVEARLRRFDGEYRWFLKRAFPLFDNAGRVLGWYGGNIDIHDLKQAEASVRRNEAHLAEAQRLSKTGSWVWNAKTKENVFWSKELRRIYGFDPETPIVQYAAARERVHPEDGAFFDETFHHALREERDFQMDHRIVLPGGEVKHIHVVGHPISNGSGELVEYIGSVLDVTERKGAELEAQTHLWFLESMDRINRAIQGTNNLEEMMSEVLKAVLSIFNCDRAWLVYPCDPQAMTWRAVMEHVRPEFPGAFALGVDLPIDPEVAAVFGRVRGSRISVCFGPESGDLVPLQLVARFSIRSMIGLAIYPKLEKPYMFGLHQCTHPRVWTLSEQRLFQEIGRRMEDALSALLMFRSLQNSEVKLEEAQRIAHVGHWERDLETNLIAWSNETYRIYGLAPQERVLNLSQVTKLLHPEDRQVMSQAVADAVNGVCPYNVEFRVIRPTGEVRFVHSKGDVVKDESGRPRRHFGTVQDITDRKLAEEALRRSETYLAEAQKLSHTGSWARNSATGKMRYWSEECYRVLGFEPHDGLPSFQTFLQRVHPDDQDKVRKTAETASREETEYEVDYRIVHPGGEIREIHTAGHPFFSPSGQLLEYIGTVMDVTERKRAEEALRRAQTELTHITRITTMGELTASIAHEVNQPLTAVVNNANACLSLLPNGAPQLEEVREALTEIINDADRASAVIANVRQLARKASPERLLVDLRDVIADILALARHESAGRRVTIRTEMPDELPCVSGDRVQLQQVLLNLVVNGMDAMNSVDESRRVLIIRARHEMRDGRREALVSVQDAGTGLKPEETARLFEAFYTTKSQGMGMGLAISRSIIEAHGGRLWAEPIQGSGATFLFSLPVEDKTEL
jgi:PAS domain S-box-containing protein